MLEAFSTLAAMSGPAPVKSMLLATGACLALAGCGSDGSGGDIPPETSEALQLALERVEQGQASEDCEMAEDAAGDFASRVEDLGDDVDESIRDSLAEGADQVSTLVDQDVCEPTGPSPTETEEVVPPPEETTEETTTTTTTTDPVEEEADGEDGEDGENGGSEEPAPQPPEEEAPPEEPPSSGEGGEPAPSDDSGGTGTGDGGVGAEE
jgi:hypothetical protein